MAKPNYEMRDRARELYVPGKFGLKKVAKELGVFPAQVARWVKEDYRLRAQQQKRDRIKSDRISLDPVRRAKVMKWSQKKFKGLPLSWFVERLGAGVCEATGIPLTLDVSKGPWSPEVDQIVPKGGYTEDNSQVVCRMYNCAKSEYTHEDVLRMVGALKGNT